MLSPQSQLMERNLALFEEGNWLIINPVDAYFADQIDHRPVTFLHQYFDIFSESVRVIPCCEFDSRDVSHSEAGFCIEQKTGAHRHLFAPFIPAETRFSDILIYMPKSKAHMQMLLAMAVSALQEDGRIHIVGENKGGIKSIGKLIEKTGPSQKVDSARHCSLVTVMPEKAGTAFKPGDWIDESEYEVQGIQWEVVSMPGVFSHGELDDGTRMLLDKGSDRLRGKVLDFACGAGVIGAHLLRRFPHLDMTLLDVSALAIYCSARTLAANQQSATLVASDGLHGVNKSFSHIVTNPPFHTGVKTDYTVTRRFIEDSRRCLNSKGTLQMVANRFLPYPGLLGDIFPQTHTVAQDSRFSLYLSICG